MKLEKGEISSSQLMLLTIAFIQGATLVLAFTYGITKHDTWLVVLSGFVISVPFILVYIALAQKFPGKNLVQINEIVYGTYVGILISGLYLFFFFYIAAANVRYIGDFFLTYIMPDTPMIAILVVFIFICALAVRSGIEVIARCSFFLVLITTAIIMLTFVLLLKDMQLTNFLPVFETPLMDFVQGTHIIVAIPFCELLVFLMVIPYCNKIKQAKSSVLLGLIMGVATFITVAFQDVAILGGLVSNMVLPSFASLYYIDIGQFLTRMEIFFAVTLFVTQFLKVSILYYAAVLGTAQLFNLRSYVPLVLPMGIICISLAIALANSTAEHAYLGINIWPIHTILYEFFLPLLTLLIAKIRGLPQKKGGTS